MPGQPDQPVTETGRSEAGQGAATGAAVEPKSTDVAVPLPLGADMARIIEEQVDTIVLRQSYHSQMMLGVSATGTDAVNARDAALTIARALRHGEDSTVQYALVNLGDPQISQINDHTVPF